MIWAQFTCVHTHSSQLFRGAQTMALGFAHGNSRVIISYHSRILYVSSLSAVAVAVAVVVKDGNTAQFTIFISGRHYTLSINLPLYTLVLSNLVCVCGNFGFVAGSMSHAVPTTRYFLGNVEIANIIIMMWFNQRSTRNEEDKNVLAAGRFLSSDDRLYEY